MTQQAVIKFQVSVRFACDCMGISESCYYYKPKLDVENKRIANKLLALVNNHKRWGFGLCYAYLRNVLGYKYNHKRVYRIYKELAVYHPEAY